jgi:bifunctional non-homologous end joining protein LigD
MAKPKPKPDADDALAEYRRKRDFGSTPEPAGEPAPRPGHDHDQVPGGGARRRRPGDTASLDLSRRLAGEDSRESSAPPLHTARFVVHQHSATRLHWDLRLEADGVLWSFALPRCLPWDPKRNNLAVHTEDHPLEYIDFEGDIPEGYGAGNMFVWDHGEYDLLERKDGKLVIDLRGRRVQGKHALFRTGAERDWIIHRMDPPADPERRWPPEFVPPMRPAGGGPAEPEAGDDWAWEMRLSGLRVMTTLLAGAVLIHDAEGNDISSRFVDVRRIGRATGSVEAVLDGVMVGEPHHLERRMTGRPLSGKRATESAPVELIAFDLVWLNGHPRWDRPWDERRTDLEALHLGGPAWGTSVVHRGDGPALVAAAGKNAQVTGLVGKRRASPYRPGETTDDWVDIDLR